MIPELLEIPALRAAFAAGLTPAALVDSLYDRIEAWPDKAVFITLVPREDARAVAQGMDMSLPLAGMPFVVKDNIDVAGMPTTAACPDFAYIPKVDATVVARLRAAGAILLGKANLDQFATGLNGTRSPYGAPRSVFNADYISGGSSSGSAVAVAAGLAAFALGTDTAGSGRVPAACNNIVGLKPSIGLIPATGVVPACKSLDCVAVFANSAADGMAVLQAAQGYDAADAYSRPVQTVTLPTTPKLGVLAARDRDFAGDAAAAALYQAAVRQAAALGWVVQEIDYAPFRNIAALLYGGAYVAERLAAVKPFYDVHAASFEPTVREIIGGAERYSAADAFTDIYKVQALRHAALAELARVDALLLPTAPTIFTVAQMQEQPIAHNATLGLYTNFVNLLDLAAIALPAGFRSTGLPFGVSLIGPAFSEASLAGYTSTLHQALGAGAGGRRASPRSGFSQPEPEEVMLVVAGAHLSGMVLNHELINLGARLVSATSTAPDYKLYALSTTPPKPGLARSPGFMGAGIAVEVWALTPEAFGWFVAALPAPMGIGRVSLADGTVHPGFLCEAYALAGATDITTHGGWRAYLKSQQSIA
ncbi:MAG: allophanate hydrolase [Acidocella sp.]|nr:allophanate hydrolase [Acidocella sp.]